MSRRLGISRRLRSTQVEALRHDPDSDLGQLLVEAAQGSPRFCHRLMWALEAEMRPEERSDPRNKYWVDVGGQRFLQVMEVNRQHFRKRPPATGGTAAAAAASPARD